MTRLATAPRPQRRALATNVASGFSRTVGHQSPREQRRRTRDARQLAQRNAKVRAAHRRFRTGLWPYFWRGDMPTLLTAPVIYSLAVPFLLLDAWVMLYQAICFRAWGIATVGRRAYFAIDRHKLAYLNGIEKLNCLFCSYTNGLLAYVREVAARTEQYWCPIHHARRVRATHERYPGFAAYGDPQAYRHKLPRLRAALRK
ncbi:MAG: hypothetical protein AB7N29_03425 [Vicinamibacterales bacterium]